MADRSHNRRSAESSYSSVKQSAQHRFPCEQCGALQSFEPGSKSLKCDYCGHETEINDSFEAIQEYDFKQALDELSDARPASPIFQVECRACGAHFKFEKTVHAGECPFCGASIVTGTGEKTPIKPRSLLPFVISEEQAFDRFRGWIKGLWFVPGKLKKYARGDTKLSGVYLPYWTYDSDTQTDYSGMRGTIYYVRQQVQMIHNGRMVSRVKQVPKIRWTPVRGRVERFFDDVLVGASRSLPRTITDPLNPWDLENLVSYKEDYLSGFKSEIYQVELDEGMDRAKQIMDGIIYRDIGFDIGGDQQRITQVKTRHSGTTFKHLLLPVWTAAFRYRGKSFQYVVNGRTGKVQGERPLSYWKIGFTAIIGSMVLAGILYWMDKSGMLQSIDRLY